MGREEIERPVQNRSPQSVCKKQKTMKMYYLFKGQTLLTHEHEQSSENACGCQARDLHQGRTNKTKNSPSMKGG